MGPVLSEHDDAINFSGTNKLAATGPPAPRALIGRTLEIDSAARALDAKRLVTLVGPGGVGKTSLAIAVAHARRGGFPERVYVLDLSSTEDPSVVPRGVTTSLGIRGDPVDVISAVVLHVQQRRMLIVLDNCEHVLSGAAYLVVRIGGPKTATCELAPSREPLGVKIESLHGVEPLAFPHGTQPRSVCEALTRPSYAMERLLRDSISQDAHRLHARLVLSLFEISESEWFWSDGSLTLDEVVCKRFLMRVPMLFGVFADTSLESGRPTEAQEAIDAD